jgi:hypothetical protein
MSREPVRQWSGGIEALATELARAAAGGSVHVVVDGPEDRAGTIADRIAGALSVLGQHCARLSDKSPLEDEDAWRADSRPGLVVVADGPRWRAAPPCGSWDAVIDARMVVEAPC